LPETLTRDSGKERKAESSSPGSPARERVVFTRQGRLRGASRRGGHFPSASPLLSSPFRSLFAVVSFLPLAGGGRREGRGRERRFRVPEPIRCKRIRPWLKLRADYHARVTNHLSSLPSFFPSDRRECRSRNIAVVCSLSPLRALRVSSYRGPRRELHPLSVRRSLRGVERTGGVVASDLLTREVFLFDTLDENESRLRSAVARLRVIEEMHFRCVVLFVFSLTSRQR